MRPIRLTMQSFASYGKRTQIDFEVPTQNIFLVTGDTGAGKSSIFDAIVFALYGETSGTGNRRFGTELQSHFAEADTEPFVELTFQEGGKVYTVTRKPARLRPKKRGEGMTLQQGEVSLLMPDGHEYPSKETNKKLCEIIGLEKEQFMQVAMIAQGEFMELLRAKSDDKKEIFGRLFGTGFYGAVTRELERRKNVLRQKTADEWSKTAACAAMIIIPEDAGNAGKLQTMKDAVTGAAQAAIGLARDLAGEVEGLCASLTEKRVQAKETYRKSAAYRDTHRKNLAEAKNLAQLYEQLETAERELAECELERPQILEKKQLQLKIRSAWEIRAVYQRYADADEAVRTMSSDSLRLEQEIPGLRSRVQECAAHEKQAKEKQEKALAFFTATDTAVKKEQEIRSRILKLEKESEDQKKIFDLAEAAAKEAGRKLQELADREKNWQEESKALSETENEHAGWRIRKEKHLQQVERVSEAEQLLTRANRQLSETGKAGKVFRERTERFEEANREYEEKRKALLNAQAGLIAREQLRPGQPCPVCGSTDHPAPCILEAEWEDLTQEAVEELRERADRKRKEQEEAAAASGSAELLLVHHVRDLRQTAGKLGIDIPSDNDALQAQISRFGEVLAELGKDLAGNEALLEEEGKQLDEKLRRKRELETLLEKAGIEKDSLIKRHDDARKAALDAGTLLEKNRSAAGILHDSAEFGSMEEAEALLEKAGEEKEKADRALGEAAGDAKKAGSALDGAASLLLRYRQELPALVKNREERLEEYGKLCGARNLTQEEWQELTGSFSKEDAEEMLKRVSAFSEKEAAAAKLRLTAKNAIMDRPKPDMAAMEKLVEEYDRTADEAMKAFTKLDTLVLENSRLLDRLKENIDCCAKTDEAYARLNMLYRMASGNVKGARMDLETYVLRRYLRSILHLANRRFMGMTGGQYELRMVEQDRAGEGKNRGLDLMVYSYVTGREREIRTLSGGESFMAALSLALGLADQIRESCPAVSLDIMFIDEGFGSLDEQARTQAVRVLQDVAGDTRMLGIISHVTELKQEIEDRLVITKDELGSHAVWQIS